MTSPTWHHFLKPDEVNAFFKVNDGRPAHLFSTSRWPFLAFSLYYVGVSLNGGTPKSSILIRFSLINHPFWDTTIFGNTHIQFQREPMMQEEIGFLFRFLHVEFVFLLVAKLSSRWKFSACPGVPPLQVSSEFGGETNSTTLGRRKEHNPLIACEQWKTSLCPCFLDHGGYATLWFLGSMTSLYGNLVLSQPVFGKYEGLDQSHSCALNFLPARGAKSVKTDMGSVLAVAKEDVYIGRAKWKLHWMELPSWQWFHDACPE